MLPCSRNNPCGYPIFYGFTAVSRGPVLCLIFAPLNSYDEPKSALGKTSRAAALVMDRAYGRPDTPALIPIAYTKSR